MQCAIDQISLAPIDATTSYRPTHTDEHNRGILQDDSTPHTLPPTTYMLGNNLYADIHPWINQAIACSVESLYQFQGFPNLQL